MNFKFVVVFDANFGSCCPAHSLAALRCIVNKTKKQQHQKVYPHKNSGRKQDAGVLFFDKPGKFYVVLDLHFRLN